MSNFEVRPVGYVHSPIASRSAAPKQGFEGASLATLVFEPGFSDALVDLEIGDEVIVLSWLDRAQRDILKVHPRDNPTNPLTGVFSTRSPDRPNPIGLHRVKIVGKRGTLEFEVQDLEAMHMTPILDIKPVLKQSRDA